MSGGWEHLEPRVCLEKVSHCSMDQIFHHENKHSMFLLMNEYDQI